MKYRALTLLGLVCINTLFAETYTPLQTNPEEIQINAVAPTPEATNVTIFIAYPAEGEVRKKDPVYTSIKIFGFPLGVNSDFNRADEIANSPEGQSLHIIVDDYPFFPEGREVINLYAESETYFENDIVVELPYVLDPGEHILRVFPARSFGESLKEEGSFVARKFYVKEKINNLDVDINEPLLTYNMPQGNFEEGKPILLDFYVTNCVISDDGFKVSMRLNDGEERILTEWSPYYILNLPAGMHTIDLKLLDPDNKVVPGPYNQVKRRFQVTPAATY